MKDLFPRIEPTEDPDDVVSTVLTHLAPPLRDGGTYVIRAQGRWGLEEAGFRELVVPVATYAGKAAAVNNVGAAWRGLLVQQFVAAGLV